MRWFVMLPSMSSGFAGPLYLAPCAVGSFLADGRAILIAAESKVPQSLRPMDVRTYEANSTSTLRNDQRARAVPSWLTLCARVGIACSGSAPSFRA